MANAPHRIRRQVWRIRAPSAADAFALRGEVRAAWEGALLPALEAAFDQAAPDDRVVRIPRLELRLRLDRAEDLAAELPRLIREAAGVELALARRGGVPAVWDADDTSVAPADDRRATLLHYLRTGTLPWAAAGGSAGDADARLRAAARTEGPRLMKGLAGEASPRAFAFRLLQLLDEADAAAWIASLPARVPTLWRRVLLRLLAPASAGPADVDPSDGGIPLPAWSPPPRHARLELASTLLPAALAGAVDDTPDALVRAVERMPEGGGGDGGAALLASLPELAAARDPQRRAAGGVGKGPRATASVPAREDDGAGRNPGAADRGDSTGSELPAPKSALADAAERIAAGAARRATDGAGEEFATSVANAGLILLHSFIPPLLEHTGIREGNAIPANHLPRAAALLHHLATGRDEPLEWELGLVKVLLGLDPETPLLVAEGLLRPEDREQCDDLLHSVIGHWTVLRSTTPAALRETFLTRGGLLRRDGPGWTLRVEHAPYDVLLSQLPWTISIARLPWMPHPIYTEWTTTP